LDSELKLEVLEAKNLKAGDIGGTSDPYCNIKFDDKTEKTSTIKSTVNPVWNEKFKFAVKTGNEILEIDIMDYDFMSTDDSIGKVKVPLSLLRD